MNAHKPRVKPVDLLEPQMSAAERSLFERYYKASSRIIEYGSGGSTYIAATQTDARICSVDSDAAWIERLETDPDLAEPLRSGRLTLIHVDIGPVGLWGKPSDTSGRANWPAYPAAPWAQMPDPDLVFIDGRFRLACILSAVVQAPADTIIMVHDFWNRRDYTAALPFLDSLANAETLAVFRPKADADRAQAKSLLEVAQYDWA